MTGEDFVKWQDKIDSVLDAFDFAALSKAMTTLRWKWSSLDRVPDEVELRQAARTLLREVIAMPPYSFTATGGFVAHRIGEADLWLAFELERESTIE